MKRILLILTILINIKFIFKRPRKTKILIWDKANYRADILKKISKEKKIFFLLRRYEEINLFILLRCLINFKLNPIEYYNQYIKYSKSKIIITFVDNYLSFYKINVKNCKKIVIQNAIRHNEFINSSSKKKFFDQRGNLQADYFFAFNKNILKKYKDLINIKKGLVNGSFLSNAVPIKKEKKINYLFISTLRNFQSSKSLLEIQLINYILKYLSCTKSILNILGPKNKNSKYDTIKFLKMNLKKENWKFINNNQKDFKFSYNKIDFAEIVMGIDSTLLYEFFSRKNKTLFFDIHRKYAENLYGKNHSHFAWPLNLKKEGHFWLSDLNYNKVVKLIEKAKDYNKKKWDYLFKKFSKEIMIFKKDNIDITMTIKKILIKQ